MKKITTIACTLALLGAVQSSAASEGPGTTTGVAAASGAQPGVTPNASATLEQCVTAATQAERSATFSGEMTAIPGSVRMAMRIEIQERIPGEPVFHAVSAPALGLGAWRSSAPGVKVYRYLKQVTNLAAPGFYRAAIRFRWMSAKGRVLKVLERDTPHCVEKPPRPEKHAAATASGG